MLAAVVRAAVFGRTVTGMSQHHDGMTVGWPNGVSRRSLGVGHPSPTSLPRVQMLGAER